MGQTGPKNIAWDTVRAADWARGSYYVASLTGVTPSAVKAARKRLSIPLHYTTRPSRLVPQGLKPTDSPSAVARKCGVSVATASKWLLSVGRPPARRGRPRRD